VIYEYIKLCVDFISVSISVFQLGVWIMDGFSIPKNVVSQNLDHMKISSH
jgi:hypothetical protein